MGCRTEVLRRPYMSQGPDRHWERGTSNFGGGGETPQKLFTLKLWQLFSSLRQIVEMSGFSKNLFQCFKYPFCWIFNIASWHLFTSN